MKRSELNSTVVRPKWPRAPQYRIRRVANDVSAFTVRAGTASGHLSVPCFLNGESARALYRWLRDEASWGLKVCEGSRILGIAPEAYQLCTPKQLRECAQIAYSAAERGFGFVREEVWDPLLCADGPTDESGVLDELVRFVRSEDFGRFICRVTQCTSVELVRVSIERYACGHFFAHTSGPPPDAEIGFSLELTPAWTGDWGGLLEFVDFFGTIERAYVPRFNSITVYSLLKPRAVSLVAPSATAARYSVVGQMRAKQEHGRDTR